MSISQLVLHLTGENIIEVIHNHLQKLTSHPFVKTIICHCFQV